MHALDVAVATAINIADGIAIVVGISIISVPGIIFDIVLLFRVGIVIDIVVGVGMYRCRVRLAKTGACFLEPIPLVLILKAWTLALAIAISIGIVASIAIVVGIVIIIESSYGRETWLRGFFSQPDICISVGYRTETFGISFDEKIYLYVEPKKVLYFDNDSDNDKTLKGRTLPRGTGETATNITTQRGTQS